MEITVPIIVAMNDSTDFITRPFLLRISVLCFTAALWNRAGHYIFILWFLLSVFFLLLSFFLAYSQTSHIGCLPYFRTRCGLRMQV